MPMPARTSSPAQHALRAGRGRRASVLSMSAIALVLGVTASLPLAAEPLRMPSAMHTLGHKGSLNCDGSRSVARHWNEQMLAAIRLDAPRPTVHARNLYHVSLAMYDTWAAFDPYATPYLHDEKAAAAAQGESEQRIAISYAAYRMLVNRFTLTPGAATTLPRLLACMQALGLDPAVTGTNGNAPAAIGNRVAAAIIASALQDHANQQGNYVDTTGFIPTNNPMLVVLPGTGGLADINAWQPLIPQGAPGVQQFLTPHWRDVTPFALQRSAPGVPYIDPGPQPRLGGVGDAQVRQDVLEVIRLSSRLDPDDGVQINVSPRVSGNNPLGSNTGTGHPVNPATGAPYADNVLLRGDWGRVLAEFWADGPQSSTPPGHWNEIANEVSDHPALIKRIGGSGPVVADLEWDVKLYLAINGAAHDSAIATWEVKRLHNASRPITLIREMGSLGQSTDPGLPSYHPNGLPLEAGLVELITAQSSAPGERHAHLAAHVGSIAIRTWRGHPPLPATQHGGVGWILAATWMPYQQRNFVTPPFPGYTSGHSGFSRAAAEVLTAFTGTPYFPGGLGEFVATSGPNGFSLGFEFGPSQQVRLQWATYYDAADEAARSRLHGGIHPSYDDLPARTIGHQVGLTAMERSRQLFGNPPELRPIPLLGAHGLALLLLSLLLTGSLAARRLR